jgi:hypothetical protein
MRPAGVKPMSRTNAPVRKVTLLAAGLPKSVRTCARRCHSAQGCPLRLGIGYLQRGDNRPGTHMGWGGWGQAMWLSNRDLCQAMERSVMAGGIGFAVLNLMSDNPGMRWDIETTKRTIGYAPQDGAAPVLTKTIEQDEQSAHDMRLMAERLDAVSLMRRW